MVRSEHVRTLFDGTQSQEFNAQWNAAMRTRTLFRTHSVSLVSGIQSITMSTSLSSLNLSWFSVLMTSFIIYLSLIHRQLKRDEGPKTVLSVEFFIVQLEGKSMSIVSN